MKLKKGMTAKEITKKLQEGLVYYERMCEMHWRNGNTVGYQNCEPVRLYLSVLLDEITE